MKLTIRRRAGEAGPALVEGDREQTNRVCRLRANSFFAIAFDERHRFATPVESDVL